MIGRKAARTCSVDTLKKKTTNDEECYEAGGITTTGTDECRTT